VTLQSISHTGLLWFGSSPNDGVYGDLALMRHQGLHYFVFQLFDMFDGRVRRITIARQIYIDQEPGPMGDRSRCRFDMWRWQDISRYNMDIHRNDSGVEAVSRIRSR
jgi:hypothetical protein